jgi:hypothetical protein
MWCRSRTGELTDEEVRFISNNADDYVARSRDYAKHLTASRRNCGDIVARGRPSLGNHPLTPERKIVCNEKDSR